MATGLIDVVKHAALEAMSNEQMCDLRYGKVVSTNPLRVQITNQLTIPSSLLVVPRQLTNYRVNVTLDWETEVNESENLEEHKHDVSGSKTITINNALKVGDKVALLRKQGGQSYFILDRI